MDSMGRLLAFRAAAKERSFSEAAKRVYRTQPAVSQAIKALEEELQEKERQRSEVQRRYQEVSRDKKVLEKLKEKREADYYSRAKLEEFKAVDDLNSSQFVRKSRI